MFIVGWTLDVCSSDLSLTIGCTTIFSGTLAKSQGLAVSVAGGGLRGGFGGDLFGSLLDGRHGRFLFSGSEGGDESLGGNGGAGIGLQIEFRGHLDQIGRAHV